MNEEERKEQEKIIKEIFEGTWEFKMIDNQGNKRSHEVKIDESGKYYQNGEYIYNIQPTIVSVLDFEKRIMKENIDIHKCNISNERNYVYEVIRYRSDDGRILSGVDMNENPIEYVKQRIMQIPY